MVDISAIAPVIIVSFTFVFFNLMKYCREQLAFKSKLSDSIFFQSMYYLSMNLTVLTIPIGINTVWISLVSAETDPATLYNLINLFESLSILSWFMYSLYIGLFILYLIIIILERLAIIKPKEGSDE